MAKALYPGSFDPITLGHLDVIRRGARIFDEVVVCVTVNRSKHCLFSLDERLALVKASVTDLPNVRVMTLDGLITQKAVELGCDVLLKGLRSAVDFDYESTMAYFNWRLAPTVETVYLGASPEWVQISSSAVRELLTYGADVADLVPSPVIEALKVGNIMNGGVE